MQEQLREAGEERMSVVAKVIELEQLLTSRGVDHAAMVQDLEARLEESQSANFDMQKSYQRQITSLQERVQALEIQISEKDAASRIASQQSRAQVRVCVCEGAF